MNFFFFFFDYHFQQMLEIDDEWREISEEKHFSRACSSEDRYVFSRDIPEKRFSTVFWTVMVDDYIT